MGSRLLAAAIPRPRAGISTKDASPGGLNNAPQVDGGRQQALDQEAGDSILTIDAPGVHNASQHLTYPHNRPGQRHCEDFRREAV
jgi:hypothetical protein